MKYLLPLLLLFLSCSSNENTKNTSSTLEESATGVGGPSAGTVVAADSIKIPDPLNELYFGVSIVATEYSFRGTYAIKAHYGANDAASEITFPHSTEKLTPALRAGDEPFSYIVGFKIVDGDTFYDYFLVKAQKEQMEMKYLKAYQLP